MTIEKDCFVVIPFGKKPDAAGKVIDFERVFEELIAKAINGENKACPGYTIEAKRCKDFEKGGWIHRKMIQELHEADLAIVDISTLNANVMYELGVRHALVREGTILIRREGTRLPFNIAGFNTVSYPAKGADAPEDDKEDFRERLRGIVCSALKQGGVDSLVHEAIDVEVRTKSPPLPETKKHEYRVLGRPGKLVGLITGDLINVRGVDGWVNSENTKMQMDRHTGRSISSVIRFHGAKKGDAGEILNDEVFDQLKAKMDDLGSVDPGTVIVTGPGELKRTNQVRSVFHVASVVGQVGQGFSPVGSLAACVDNVLLAADAQGGIGSIVFPLMGTGTARGKLEKRGRELLGAAVAYFRNHPKSGIKKIYFLTWKRDERDVCSRILQQDERLEHIPPRRRRRQKGARRILSLDGGGVRGIVTLAFLAKIEQILRARNGNDPAFRLSDYFDLIGGTSTGAIIAGALAMGESVEDVQKMYRDLCGRIFRTSWLRRGLLRTKFKKAELEKALRCLFDDDTTLESSKLKTKLMVMTKRLDTGSAWPLNNNPAGKYFDTADAEWVPNKDYLLWKVIRASTAAPSYFKPEELVVVAGKDGLTGVTGQFVDGGVSTANNPALQLLMLATLDGYNIGWNLGHKNLLLVSVGTGIGPSKLASHWSHRIPGMHAVNALLSLMSDCNDQVETIMQWMSTSPTSRPIDGEIGDLQSDRLSNADLLTYQRYNIQFEKEWMQQRGHPHDLAELRELAKMDEPANLDRLEKIAIGAAEEQVKKAHLPARFDL